MATLNTPITFTQFSPYVRGTVTYEWTDTAAVSAVSGFNASADGISSVTTNLSSANVVIAFDSNVDATVNLTACTSGAQLTVPNDYNKDILLKITSDLQVGQVHSATSTARKIVKHTFVGTSDSTLTSSPANPSFTDIEAMAGTTKSLGTFSVNDVDAGSPTYSATMTYRKDLGTITYSDTSIVNSSGADKDIISTTNVSTLNTVLSGMVYVPDVNGNPVTNQTAIVGDTLTLSLESTADKKINGSPVNITTSVSDTIQLTNTASALAFTEAEVIAGTAKAFGTNVGVSPVFNNPGVTVNCKITYDKAKTTITYPDTSIVDSTQPTHDTVSSTDMSKINTALQTMTVIPISLTSGSDLEGNFTGQTLSIDLSTTPAITIGTNTTSLSYTASTDTEITASASFQRVATGKDYFQTVFTVNAGSFTQESLESYRMRYLRNTPFPFLHNVSSGAIAGTEESGDTYGGADIIVDTTVSSTEIYALVFDMEDDLGTIELSPTSKSGVLSSLTTQTAVLNHYGLTSSTFTKYAGTGAATGISSRAVILQGKKADLNAVLKLVSTGNSTSDPNSIGWILSGGAGGYPRTPSGGSVKGGGLHFVPNFKNQDVSLQSSLYHLTLYRAPAGTSSTIDINSNLSTFTKIYENRNNVIEEMSGGFGVRILESVRFPNQATGPLQPIVTSEDLNYYSGTNHPGYNMSRSATTATDASGSTATVPAPKRNSFYITSGTSGAIYIASPNHYVGGTELRTPGSVTPASTDNTTLNDLVARIFIKTNMASGTDFKSGHSYLFAQDKNDQNDFTTSDPIVTGSGTAVGGASTVYSSDGFTEIGHYGGYLGVLAQWFNGFQHRNLKDTSGNGPAVGSTWTYRLSVEERDASGPQSDTSKIFYIDIPITMIT